MLAQIIFIIEKKKNLLIFLGLLDENIKANQDDLSKFLREIVTEVINLRIKSFSKIQISDKNYFIGNLDKVIIVIQYLKDNPNPEDLINELKKRFVAEYYNILENYNDNDIPEFKSFLGTIKEFSPEYLKNTIEDLNNVGLETIVEPLKRDAYPEGVSDYDRDEVLWNEAKIVKDKYPANFVEGMIFNLEIYLSISSTQNYKIYIDFSNYPLKPIIAIGKQLKRELGEDLNELEDLFKNWDIKKPLHIIEIVDKFKVVLNKFKDQNRLSDTSEIPKSALPELKPLPNVNALDENKDNK